MDASDDMCKSWKDVCRQIIVAMVLRYAVLSACGGLVIVVAGVHNCTADSVCPRTSLFLLICHRLGLLQIPGYFPL